MAAFSDAEKDVYLQNVDFYGDSGLDSKIEKTFNEEIEPLDTKLQNLGEQQRLIITILQGIQKSSSKHHAEAATKENVVSEGILSRQHTKIQVEKMQETIEQLRKYIDSYSSKRQLTIYSSLMLLVSCILLLIVIFRGNLIISSPIPELAVIVSIAFLLMARFAPKYGRKKEP